MIKNSVSFFLLWNEKVAQPSQVQLSAPPPTILPSIIGLPLDPPKVSMMFPLMQSFAVSKDH